MSHFLSLPAGKQFSRVISSLGPQGSGCDQATLGTGDADLSFRIHSFYFLNPEHRVHLGPSLRLHPCTRLAFENGDIPTAPRPTPTLSRKPSRNAPGPTDPSFRSLMVDLYACGL